MERLSRLGDAALLERIERLERAEQMLQQTAIARVTQAEASGALRRADRGSACLSSALRKVRHDLLETEDEFLRRDPLRLERVV